jgi:hypothetical protein
MTLPLAALLMAAAPFKLAAMGLSVVGLPAEKAQFYTEHVAQELTAAGVQVFTQKEIGALLGLERQKQLLGCSDASSSCLAELASAMGADGLLIGEVGKLEGGVFQLGLKVVWSRDGRPLSSFIGRAVSEPQAVDVLSMGAGFIAADLAGDWARLIQAPASHSYSPTSALRRWSWAPAVLAAVSFGVGAAGWLQSAGAATTLRTSSFASPAEASTVAGQGETWQTIGGVMLSIGAVAVVGALVMFLLGASP